MKGRDPLWEGWPSPGQWGVDGRATGLRVMTTALGALSGRASQSGGAENDTMGGRVVTGPTGVVKGF